MEKRIIDGNEPAAPLIKVAAYSTTEFLGTPVKLEIAATMMAARITGLVYFGKPFNRFDVSQQALLDADALLNAYNNS